MADWFVKKGKYLKKFRVEYERRDGLIVFTKSSFNIKDEIKCMRGAQWVHDKKQWIAEDHQRNWFQIRALEGGNVYEHFEQPIITHPGIREECLGDFSYQADSINNILTRHFQIIWGDAGVGKTLITAEVMRLSGFSNWLWVGPLSSRDSVMWDWEKWGYEPPTFINFDRLHQIDFVPQGVIFDESHKLKHPGSLRSTAAQEIADAARAEYGWDAYVLCLTGTPATKSPANWYAQSEIVWPGFLREGCVDAFSKRYGIFEDVAAEIAGVPTQKLVGWDEDEVAKLEGRLEGQVYRIKKEIALSNLPEIEYTRVNLPMTDDLKAVAKAIGNTTPTGSQLAQKLRQLADGFQYIEKGDKKEAYEIPCPKEDKLREWSKGQNRILVSAGYTASVDRCIRILQEEGFAVIRCDGKKFACLHDQKMPPLKFWAEHDGPVAFVANPQSGGTSFTLVEANRVIIYSNDFHPDARIQVINRLHRPGQTKNVEVIDLLHGPSDYRILDTLQDNRRIELLSHGELLEGF